MLSIRPFSLAQPTNRTQLYQCLADADSTTKIIAGGTDLLPNLKHGLYNTKRIIALNSVDGLDGLEIGKDRIRFGATLKLNRIEHDQRLMQIMPSISSAVRHIASPQIRGMGTVGGNICLDTRCCYFNQSEFWRQALGYCLKKDGSACHVVKTGKRCVAAASNDLATMLLAYDAELTIESLHQERAVKLENFYTPNGEKNNVLTPHEVVSTATIAIKPNTVGGFAKLRHRLSFDFPLLSVGVVFTIIENKLFLGGRLVINALVAKPKIFDLSSFADTSYDETLVNRIACFAQEKCHPQTNMAEDTAWRKELIAPMIRRAIYEACPIRI